MKKYAIILAGGSGMRAGGDVPKQFQMLDGIPMLWWSVRAFYNEDSDTDIRLVMNPGFFDLWNIIYRDLPAEDKEIPVTLVCGGRSRLESVKNGIMGIQAEKDALVAVHDSARPLVGCELISEGWRVASEKYAAVPAVPVTDSLRRIGADGFSEAVARKDYVAVQTPQVFRCDILKSAYEKPLDDDMTDDASVVEASGVNVSLFEGSTRNMKVTNPLDMDIAALLMRLSGNEEK